MPKQAKSILSKLGKICRKFNNEFSATPGGELRCDLCEVIVKCEKKYFVESHRKSKRHQARLENQASSSRQTYIERTTTLNHTEKVVSAFSSADIPLHKLNHPALKSLFSSSENGLPSETAARASVAKLARQKEDEICDTLRDKKIFMVVDEADVAGQKYVNVLVGCLEAPTETFLIDCIPHNESMNSRTIVHTVDDTLRRLGTARTHFNLLLTDAARYMALAGKTLKEFYPYLLHVTCLAHLLHNCAMRVRAHFKNIDAVVAAMKAATVKNKERCKDFSDAGLPSPPAPVVTRWATWLEAAFFYAEHLPVVRNIVNNWKSGGILVTRAKEAINEDQLISDLVLILQYQPLARNVELLEATDCRMADAFKLIKNMDFLEDPCEIQNYIDRRLSGSDIETMINSSVSNIPPATYALLQKAQATSATAERSFSMLKKLLRKDRNFKSENVKKYMLLYYNQ